MKINVESKNKIKVDAVAEILKEYTKQAIRTALIHLENRELYKVIK